MTTPSTTSTPASTTNPTRFQEPGAQALSQSPDANAPTEPEIKVHTIGGKEELDNLLTEAGNKYIIIEFFADWCGPCRMIAPRLDEMAVKMATKAIIIKVNVEDFEEIAIGFEVTSMPTFIFLKNKKKIGEIVGSNIEKILTTIEKVCSGEPFASIITPPTAAATPTHSPTGETTTAPAATAATTTTKTPPTPAASTAESPGNDVAKNN